MGGDSPNKPCHELPGRSLNVSESVAFGYQPPMLQGRGKHNFSLQGLGEDEKNDAQFDFYLSGF